MLTRLHGRAGRSAALLFTYYKIHFSRMVVHKYIYYIQYLYQWHSQNTEKSYAHQRETTGSSSDSLQLCPFSKWKLLLKERICSQREQNLSFKSSSLWYVKSLLPHKVTSLEYYYFIMHVRNCVMGATPMCTYYNIQI